MKTAPKKRFRDQSEYSKRYYAANRDKICKRQRRYNVKNREAIREYQREYQRRYRARHVTERREYLLENRESVRDNKREYQRAQLASSPVFRLARYFRTRIYTALKGAYKSARTLELLGCSIEFLRDHLEKQFRPGMTWENYGPVWHVDHKRPCASFDLTVPANQKACFKWSNLQPLFAVDNIKKGARIL